ncbi:glycosyltransferase family 2 protein [Moorellaceae bacterium AZ2]
MQQRTLVIIPAYNEAGTIRRVIRSIREWANVDILVVNDGSQDNTRAEARAEGVRVIDLPYNLGIGGAMQTGYLYAYLNDYDFAVQVDADGQHDPMYINSLLLPLKAGEADMVIGSRYKQKTGYRGPLARRMGSLFFTGLLKLLTGQTIYDSTSGFRAINKRVIKYFAYHYPQDYPEVEVITRLSRNGFRIKEIAVEMYPRECGKSSITVLKSIYYMIKVSLAVIINSWSPIPARGRDKSNAGVYS